MHVLKAEAQVMWVTKQLTVAIDLHSIFPPYYGSQWIPSTVWLLTFFKMSSFVLKIRNKPMQVWNNLKVSKEWQIVGWKIPLTFCNFAQQLISVFDNSTQKWNTGYEVHTPNLAFFISSNVWRKLPSSLLQKWVLLIAWVFTTACIAYDTELLTHEQITCLCNSICVCFESVFRVK